MTSGANRKAKVLAVTGFSRPWPIGWLPWIGWLPELPERSPRPPCRPPYRHKRHRKFLRVLPRLKCRCHRGLAHSRFHGGNMVRVFFNLCWVRVILTW